MACFACGGEDLEQDKELDNYSTFGSGEIKGWLEKLSKGSIWTSPHYQMRYFLLRSLDHGRYELQYFQDEIARQQGVPPRLRIDLSKVSPEDFQVLDAAGKMSLPVPEGQVGQGFRVLEMRAPANDVRDVWVEKIMFAIYRSNGLAMGERFVKTGSRSRTTTEDSEYDGGDFLGDDDDGNDDDDDDSWESEEEKEDAEEDSIGFKVQTEIGQSHSQVPAPPASVSATSSASPRLSSASPRLSSSVAQGSKNAEAPLLPIVLAKGVIGLDMIREDEEDVAAEEENKKKKKKKRRRKKSRSASKRGNNQRNQSTRPTRARSLKRSPGNSFDFAAFSDDSLAELCSDVELQIVLSDHVDGVSAGEDFVIG